MARKRAGLSQDELGEKLGVGRNAISAWENDARVPDGEFLLRLPEALNCSADWLLLDRPVHGASAIPPREALEALRDWMDGILPPGGSSSAEGNGDND